MSNVYSHYLKILHDKFFVLLSKFLKLKSIENNIFVLFTKYFCLFIFVRYKIKITKIIPSVQKS